MRTSVGEPEVTGMMVRLGLVMRRLPAAALVVLGLALATPIGAPAAHAVETCATEELTPQQQARLDYVFLGRVSDVAESAKDGEVTRIYTVQVERWWRGELPKQIRVTSPAGSSECGLRAVRKGTSYLFMAGAADGDDQVRALSYEGTRKADARTEQEVTRRLGVEAQRPVAERTEQEQREAGTPTVLDDSEPPAVADVITLPVIVVVAGIALFGLGALLGRREH